MEKKLHDNRKSHDNRKCETCGIKQKHCNCCLEYKNFKDDLIDYKCLICNKNHQTKFYEKLKERFLNTYKFSNHDNNKSILLVRKGDKLFGNTWMIEKIL